MVDSAVQTRRLLNLVTVMLVLLALLKVVYVTFTTPLLGYANNYDFLRQSSCIGLWQDYQDPTITKISSHPSAPVDRLIYDGDRQPILCMQSVDNLFAALAVAHHDLGDRLTFSELGRWKVALLLLGLLAMLTWVREAKIRLAVALAFFLVFTDLVNLLYINTLYMEFSVILASFFALLLGIYLIAAAGRNQTAVLGMFFFWVIWLGLSKQQYMPFAVLLALGNGVLFGWQRRPVRMLLAVLVALGLPWGYANLNDATSGHMQSVNLANKTDTFLWAVLPASRTPEQALQLLGLPEHCMAGIGKHWYIPEVQSNHPCPEVEQLSRVRLLPLFVLEPATFWQPFTQAVAGMPPYYPDVVGYIGQGRDPAAWPLPVLQQTSLSFWLAKSGPVGAGIITAVAGLLAVLALLALAGKKERDTTVRFCLWLLLGGATMSYYAVVSSVFGDGYVDLQKHGVGFMIGLALQLSAILILAGQLAWRAMSHR